MSDEIELAVNQSQLIKVPCCVAINNAIANFNQGLADLVTKFGPIINAAFDAANAAARTAIALAAITALGVQFRAAIARLIALSQQCDSPCCASAATAIANTAVATAQLILAAAANIVIPLTNPVTPLFSLIGIIATVLGSAALPPGTPNVPPGLTGTFSEYVELILSTIDCPCPPCPCKPCDKFKKSRHNRNY